MLDMDEERGSYLIRSVAASAEWLLVTNLCSVHGNFKLSQHEPNSYLSWIRNSYHTVHIPYLCKNSASTANERISWLYVPARNKPKNLQNRVQYLCMAIMGKIWGYFFCDIFRIEFCNDTKLTINDYIRKGETISVKRYLQRGLSMGAFVIHSDSLMTELAWHCL